MFVAQEAIVFLQDRILLSIDKKNMLVAWLLFVLQAQPFYEDDGYS